jgi:hypothetical protein
MSTIKVQIVGGGSVKSLIEAGPESCNPEFAKNNHLTFHAYSDTMKARILEQMIKSPARIGISFTDEPYRTGEWHEPLIVDAIFNRSQSLVRQEFLTLTDYQTGEPIYLDVSQITFIRQIGSGDTYPRHTSVGTLSNNQVFLVREEAAWIARIIAKKM